MKIIRALSFLGLLVFSTFVFAPTAASAHEGRKSSASCTTNGAGTRLGGNWGNTWCVMGKDSNRYVHQSNSVAVAQVIVWCKYTGSDNTPGANVISKFTDGYFGQRTEEYVKRFQSDYGLGSDGVIGRTTINILANSLEYSGKSPEGYPEFIVKNSRCGSVAVLEYVNGTWKAIYR